MEKPAQHSGFTLIELVVALAVFGLLIGIGLPSFQSAIANSRISTQNNDAIGALFIARSEAVKASVNVTVCARAENQTRTCKPASGDWSDGALVFIDRTPIASAGIVAVGAEDTIIHAEPALTGDNTLLVSGSLDNTSGSQVSTPFITYNPNGSTNWRGASLTLCDDRGPSLARAINIVITGDIRRGRTPNGGSAPLDTFGNPATCP